MSGDTWRRFGKCRADCMSGTAELRRPHPAIYLLTGVFFVILFRTAWVSDDAFITFRTVDNLLNGYGLRWNVVERVQSYTHPLWMFAIAAGHWITGEPY